MKYIVGLGNETRGDDGIGPKIVHYLLEQPPQEGFCAIDLASNIWGLLPLLTENTQKILLIDCSYLGKSAGNFQFFSLKNITDKKNKSIENHELSLLQFIQLVQKTDYKVPPFTLMGIEPEQVMLGSGLSVTIEKKVPFYAQQALDFL